MKVLFIALSLVTSFSLQAQAHELDAKFKAETLVTVSVFKQSAVIIPAILSETGVQIAKNQDFEFRKAKLLQAVFQIMDAIERSSKNDQIFYYQIHSRLNLPKYLLGEVPLCTSSLCAVVTAFEINPKQFAIDDVYLRQIGLRLDALIIQATDKANAFESR